MSVWTTPKTFISFVKLTAGELNAYLSGNTQYLKDVIDSLVFSGVQAVRNSAQSIPTATYTNITFTTHPIDVGPWWTSGTDLVVPASAIPVGFTRVMLMAVARVRFDANGTGWRRLTIAKNGTGFAFVSGSAVNDGNTTDLLAVDFIDVVAGDVITVQAWQSSGGNLNVNQIQMSLVRFAPID